MKKRLQPRQSNGKFACKVQIIENQHNTKAPAMPEPFKTIYDFLQQNSTKEWGIAYVPDKIIASFSTHLNSCERHVNFFIDDNNWCFTVYISGTNVSNYIATAITDTASTLIVLQQAQALHMCCGVRGTTHSNQN